MILFFYTITIDFIILLLSFENEINVVFITTNKYSKRISMFSKMTTWSASQWTVSWFDSFQKKKWSLLRTILFDWNRKFVVVFWKIIFNHLKTIFLFITAYHLQKKRSIEKNESNFKNLFKICVYEKKV